MISHYYAMLFRMKYIKRWSLMHNLSDETLSEHSMETAFRQKFQRRKGLRCCPFSRHSGNSDRRFADPD